MNNSLAEVHPELIWEWSEKNLPLTPDDITLGSNKKVVMDSYDDKQKGKGRNYKAFFADLCRDVY